MKIFVIINCHRVERQGQAINFAVQNHIVLNGLHILAILDRSGEAEVDLMLGEYRKLDPGPIEEFIFYDHPGGRTRITAAMRWKAEHLPGAPLGSVGR